MARYSSASLRYSSSIRRVSFSASTADSCAVWPSCHKNSVVRKKSLVLISQRTTLAHWLINKGRSLYDCIHFLYIDQITVSDVGRTITSSSSLDSGSTTIPLFSSDFKRVCVTTAHSFAKPSI